MNITDALYHQSSEEVGVRLIIQIENLIPIINLQAANFIEFQVDGQNKTFTFYHYFDSQPTMPSSTNYAIALRHNPLA